MKIHSNIVGTTISRLAQTQRVIARALDRMSSGNNLARPADDIAAFATLTRLQTASRDKLMRMQNLNQESAILNTTQVAVESQVSIAQQMRALVIEATNSTLQSSDRQRIQEEMSQLLEEFNRIANDANSNAMSMLNGQPALASEVFKKNIGTMTYTTNNYSAHPLGSEVAVGDIDNDGHLDIVYGSNFSTVFGVSLGNGQGQFTVQQTSTATVTDILLEDFDNDGNLDVVYTDGTNLSIRLGEGDGTFGSITTVSAASRGQITVGDFNEDGNLDILAAQSSTGPATVVLYTGNGEGSFTAAATATVGFNISSAFNQASVGDLNGDGHLDFAIADYIDNTVSVVIGNGDGTFQNRTTFTAIGNPSTNTLTDLDDDGDLDIVTGGSLNIRYLLNNGSGSFGASTLFVNHVSLAFNLTFEDLDLDGQDDLIVDGYIYRRNSPFNYTQTSSASSRFVGDFNEDGVPDFANGWNVSIQNIAKKSGISELGTISIENHENALRILDEALNRLNDSLSKLATQQLKREREADSHLMIHESLESAVAALREPDWAKETATLVAEQIRMQAQVAVLAQANVQSQMVLQLLRDL